MKRRSPRRRRMGAMPASVELIAGGVAGSLATKTIVANMRPPMAMGDTDVRPFVGIVLGLGLMYVGKGNKAMEGAAVGAIAESAATMISTPSKPLEKYSALWCPYWWRVSAGRPARWTANAATAAVTTLTVLSSASE